MLTVDCYIDTSPLESMHIGFTALVKGFYFTGEIIDGVLFFYKGELLRELNLES